MLEKLKSLFTDVHLGWKEEVMPLKNAIGGYPCDEVDLGDKGYLCDGPRQAACNVYCCSNILPIHINPLEMVMISHSTSKPPYEFTVPKRPTLTDFGRSTITTPFRIKTTRKGYCDFSGMPDSRECKEYTNRPLICRTFPIVFSTMGNTLYQRRGCPGFKKGGRMTAPEVVEYKKIGAAYTLLGDTLFNVPYNVLGNPKQGAEFILESMDIDPTEVQSVSKESFHECVEMAKDISDIEKLMVKRRIDQSWFEKFMLREYNVESEEKEQLAIPIRA
jgi:Fe-S-cluster containining protein